ncbi:unnamed protein product [Mytilus coruscus]|uniref:Uncharacterized protein n=1 Tax=Mytilus coruscus TaxID=42192 RepID=A0A6J8EM20_MYTCO|nr:unnamed protein product [Mytilus coruscus]
MLRAITGIVCIVTIMLTSTEGTAAKPRYRRGSVEAKLDEQNENLKAHDHDQCVEKIICVLAALPESDFNRYSNNPASFIVSLAPGSSKGKQISEEQKKRALEMLKNFHSIEELVQAAEYGQTVQDSHQCGTHFSDCVLSHDNVLKVIEKFSDLEAVATESGKQMLEDFGQINGSKRDTRCNENARTQMCSAITGGCIASTIGCVICAALTAGICFAGCGPVIGVPCGVAMGSCNVAGLVC